MPPKTFHSWCKKFWKEQSKIDFVWRKRAADWVMEALDDENMKWTECFTDYIHYLDKIHPNDDSYIRCFVDAWEFSGRKVSYACDQCYQFLQKDCTCDDGSFRGWCEKFWREESQIDFVWRTRAADWVMDALNDDGMKWTENFTDYIRYLEKFHSNGALDCFVEAWELSGRDVSYECEECSEFLEKNCTCIDEKKKRKKRK